MRDEDFEPGLPIEERVLSIIPCASGEYLWFRNVSGETWCHPVSYWVHIHVRFSTGESTEVMRPVAHSEKLGFNPVLLSRQSLALGVRGNGPEDALWAAAAKYPVAPWTKAHQEWQARRDLRTRTAAP